MPLRFSVARHFHAPPGEVFAALTDLDRIGEWMPGFVSMVPTERGPLRVGSGWRETRKRFGRETSELFRVTELAPPRRLALRVDGTQGTSGRGEFVYTYALEPRGGGTDLTLDVEFRSMTFLAGLVGTLMKGTIRSLYVQDLEALALHLAKGREQERGNRGHSVHA